MLLSSCSSDKSPSGEDVRGTASKGFWDVEDMKAPFKEEVEGSRKGFEEDWDEERESEIGSS